MMVRMSVATLHTVADGQKGERPGDLIYLQGRDQLPRPAAEEDLYNYTTKRWLYNEAYELSRRRVRFNLQGLMAKSVEVVGQGVTKCVRIMKFREGEYNKVFLLTMDNGIEVVAKIPNPNAGPAHYTTASEVATMDYLQKTFEVPVPKVLAWSSNTLNPVESEYIIMEKARGTVLSECWGQMERTAKNEIIAQIVRIQTLLSSKPFPAHGCLFFQEDLPQNNRCSDNVPSDPSRRYSIGPLVDPTIWEDGRDKLPISKGPWTCLQNYAIDLGNIEREWVKLNARPRMNYPRDVKFPEQPSEALETINKYLLVAPSISRTTNETRDLATRIFSHRDLNLSNIFIDPSTNEITAIIDWQGSTIGPLVLQAEIPRMVRHFPPLNPGLFLPETPDDYNILDPDAKRKADITHESALCQKYYEGLTAKANSLLYSAIIHNDTSAAPFVEPLQLICGCWTNREVWKLRASLINLSERWDELNIDVACPLVFTKEELHKHDNELENLDYIESIMEAFENESILPADGRVDPEDFDAYQSVNRDQKEKYVSLSDSEDDRRLRAATWPWQDWPERVSNS